MDQAPSSPTKTLSSTPTAWVTMAAAIALEAAMTRNGRGRPQRARRHARRQGGDRNRCKDHARKSRERGRFRIGQQHAEKGQAATLRIVVMIPDVVWRKAVIFQDFKIVIEVVRIIIAAAAGKKS